MPQTKSLTKKILLSCNQNSLVTSVNKQCSPKVCFGEVFHIKCIVIKWSHMQITSCWKHFTFTKKERDETILFWFFICLFVSFYFAFLKILQPMTRYKQVCSHVPFIHLSLGWIMHPDYKRKKSCQRVRMLTIRFKPFLSMKITLQHSFIVKHITHWFWYDDIYHLWNLYLQKEKKKGRKTRKLLIPRLAKELIVSSKVWFIFGSNPGVRWFYLTLLGEIFILSLTGTYLFNFSRNHNHFVWKIIVFDQSLRTRFLKK